VQAAFERRARDFRLRIRRGRNGKRVQAIRVQQNSPVVNKARYSKGLCGRLRARLLSGCDRNHLCSRVGPERRHQDLSAVSAAYNA